MRDLDEVVVEARRLERIGQANSTGELASVLFRQIQNRAKANAAKLAALGKPPFMAVVPDKATEGAYITLEQLDDKPELRILQKPANGKLTKGERSYTYQPELRGNENNEDRFTYATPSGRGEVCLQLQTETGQRRIAHVLHDALPNHDTPIRLTVKATRNAPTLSMTDAPEQTGQCITLPSLEAIAHDPNATLTLNIGRLPQGGTISDGKNTFTVTETSTIDLTGWNLNILTFLPPPGFNGGFTLNIQATESREGQPDAITSASIKIGVFTSKGDKRHSNVSQASSVKGETVSTKTASITVHSVLPDPDAKPPREMETHFHVINLASSRASSAEPKPVINWTCKAPDMEIRDKGWIPQLLAGTKEKVRSLAEITGLFFPYNREEER
ncbi:hypothetical protein FACS189475_05700 [Betaproteobacteria bacterium]|nr:hypothetical protein FACS189475_05700 [Betaproteobacteria bacterium]